MRGNSDKNSNRNVIEISDILYNYRLSLHNAAKEIKMPTNLIDCNIFFYLLQGYSTDKYCRMKNLGINSVSSNKIKITKVSKFTK